MEGGGQVPPIYPNFTKINVNNFVPVMKIRRGGVGLVIK